MSVRRKPCPSCPWRKDQDATVIPGFSLDLAENLRGTCSGEFGAPIFACHQSRDGDEVVCAGWAARYGGDSLAMRLRVLGGAEQPEILQGPDDDWPELEETFDDVIEKLRETTR